MKRQWVVHKESEVQASRRNLMMQSLQAVRSVLDALVELITNSDDKYGEDSAGKIIIEITRHRGTKQRTLVVKDRAGGMALAQMKEKILRYGDFVADERSRGFMGRGAKDVAALGNARFEAIKNGQLGCVEITNEFRTREMKPVRATSADFKEFGLKPNQGGMRVTVELTKGHNLPQHDHLCRDLQRHYALRDILSRRQVRLQDYPSGRKTVVRYTPPDGDLVLDEKLNFGAPYEPAKARLQLFKAKKELPSDLQEGIIVCDEFAVHQVTRFSQDLDQDPVGRCFFGRLECPYIRDLQVEFEEYRRENRDYPDHNPVDIIDPNRKRGLDIDHHPFARKLFQWAEGLLRDEVEKINSEKRSQAQEVASKETRKCLKELSKIATKHLKTRLDEELVSVSTPEQEAELFQVGVLLNPPFRRLEVGETKRLGYTVISFGVEDPSHVAVEVDGEGVEFSTLKPTLRPQRRNPDRLTAYFEVTGTKPSERVILRVIHSNELIPPVERVLEIIEPAEPYGNYPSGVAFENQHYTVHDNGTRTLTFTAKGKKFRGVGWSSLGLIYSSNPEAVSLMSGGIPKVDQLARDLWRGEVKIRGRGIGLQSTITIAVPTKQGQEITNTSISVSTKGQPPGSLLEFELVPKSNGQWRAEWDRKMPNKLYIFTKHPTLDRYLRLDGDRYVGDNNAHFRVLLAEIIAGKIVERILAEKMETDSKLRDPSVFFFRYTEELTSFLPIAHKIMIPDRLAEKLIGE